MASFAGPAQQPDPVKSRHIYIAQHNIIVLRFEHIPGGLAIGRFVRFVALPRHLLSDDEAKVLFIINYQ